MNHSNHPRPLMYTDHDPTEGLKCHGPLPITIPGEYGFELRVLGQFVQGQHQLLPALERVVTGMKSGDEKKVELSAEESFGPYDTKKRKLFGRATCQTGQRKEISS